MVKWGPWTISAPKLRATLNLHCHHNEQSCNKRECIPHRTRIAPPRLSCNLAQGAVRLGSTCGGARATARRRSVVCRDALCDWLRTTKLHAVQGLLGGAPDCRLGSRRVVPPGHVCSGILGEAALSRHRA